MHNVIHDGVRYYETNMYKKRKITVRVQRIWSNYDNFGVTSTLG